MPIILLIIFAILIAQVGFWDALGAVLGAVAMLVLFLLLLAAAAAIAAYLVFSARAAPLLSHEALGPDRSERVVT